jgi:hypothetical protein
VVENHSPVANFLQRRQHTRRLSNDVPMSRVHLPIHNRSDHLQLLSRPTHFCTPVHRLSFAGVDDVSTNYIDDPDAFFLTPADLIDVLWGSMSLACSYSYASFGSISSSCPTTIDDVLTKHVYDSLASLSGLSFSTYCSICITV